MKWNLKPFSAVKSLAATLSLATLCVTPLAQGAEAKNKAAATQKELINEYLRQTGLTTKKVTAVQFWRMNRPSHSAAFQHYMDQWILSDREMPMPTVEATEIKGRDGNQIRLLFTNKKDGTTIAATFTGDASVKINGVRVSESELLDTKNFRSLLEKLAKGDASLGKMIQLDPPKRTLSSNPIMNLNDFKTLTAAQKIEYFIRLRQVAESADRVMKAHYGLKAANDFNKKHEYALNLLFGFDAQAKSGTASGQPCIAAGYLTQYGENNSCGGDQSGWSDIQSKMTAMKASCSGGGLACNPMVYGFDQGGNAFCMSRADAKYATKKCNEMSPLDRDASGQPFDEKTAAKNKKRIVESYMKKVNGKDINLVLNDQNNISVDQYEQVKQYFEDLKNYIGSAVAACGQVPLSDTQLARDDQASACQEISTRAFALEGFPAAPQPGDDGSNCESKLSGSVPEGKDCICPEGARMEGTSCVFADTNEGPVKPQKEEKKKSNSIFPILAVLGIVGVGAWLIYRNTDSKPNPPTYVPPVPPPFPPTPTPTPTCTPPNVLQGSICVPPPAPNEGGTTTPTVGTGGGVR